MKQLLLARHAEAQAPEAGQRDVARALTASGSSDAQAMARRLRERGRVPDLIVSSHARRALGTAQLFAVGLDYAPANIDIRDELYASSVDIWLSVIRGLPPACDSVMIVGHNPEITALLDQLSGVAVAGMPTCAVAYLAYEAVHWDGMENRRPASRDIDYPGRN